LEEQALEKDLDNSKNLLRIRKMRVAGIDNAEGKTAHYRAYDKFF
jgi:hypothetical protein